MTQSVTKPRQAGLYRPEQAGTRPDAQHEAWLVRTEALINNFEEASPQSISPALGFVVMAADFLWAEHGEHADFGKLNLRAFGEACRQLLGSVEALRGFSDTLRAFYDFLSRRGLIDPATHAAMRHELSSLPQAFTHPILKSPR